MESGQTTTPREPRHVVYVTNNIHHAEKHLRFLGGLRHRGIEVTVVAPLAGNESWPQEKTMLGQHNVISLPNPQVNMGRAGVGLMRETLAKIQVRIGQQPAVIVFDAANPTTVMDALGRSLAKLVRPGDGEWRHRVRLYSLVNESTFQPRRKQLGKRHKGPWEKTIFGRPIPDNHELAKRLSELGVSGPGPLLAPESWGNAQNPYLGLQVAVEDGCLALAKAPNYYPTAVAEDAGNSYGTMSNSANQNSSGRSRRVGRRPNVTVFAQFASSETAKEVEQVRKWLLALTLLRAIGRETGVLQHINLAASTVGLPSDVDRELRRWIARTKDPLGILVTRATPWELATISSAYIAAATAHEATGPCAAGLALLGASHGRLNGDLAGDLGIGLNGRFDDIWIPTEVLERYQLKFPKTAVKVQDGAEYYRPFQETLPTRSGFVKVRDAKVVTFAKMSERTQAALLEHLMSDQEQAEQVAHYNPMLKQMLLPVRAAQLKRASEPVTTPDRRMIQFVRGSDRIKTDTPAKMHREVQERFATNVPRAMAMLEHDPEMSMSPTELFLQDLQELFRHPQRPTTRLLLLNNEGRLTLQP